MEKIKTFIKRLVYGKPYEGNLKPGDRIFSKFFNRDLIITRIISNKVWYFRIEHPNYDMLRWYEEGSELKANTELSYFENEKV